ncbi:hypothetical protein AACH10_16700 [Ideonella sp. DXS22W]|uniref:Uncharacterized protein n=1 Tax=Pseudaquabacterium inlustre TaxID=2984192 RepID=A0ABU9CJ69_9BURK
MGVTVAGSGGGDQRARHRLLGRVYGLAMAALLAVTFVIAAGAVLEGQPMKGAFNV